MKNRFQVLEEGLCVELQQRYIYHLEKKKTKKKTMGNPGRCPRPRGAAVAVVAAVVGPGDRATPSLMKIIIALVFMLKVLSSGTTNQKGV